MSKCLKCGHDVVYDSGWKQECNNPGCTNFRLVTPEVSGLILPEVGFNVPEHAIITWRHPTPCDEVDWKTRCQVWQSYIDSALHEVKDGSRRWLYFGAGYLIESVDYSNMSKVRWITNTGIHIDVARGSSDVRCSYCDKTFWGPSTDADRRSGGVGIYCDPRVAGEVVSSWCKP